MQLALRLARRAFGQTSPNPMVGAVLVRRGKVIGQGWHRGAGKPHAEIEALRDAKAKGNNPRGATLFVTLEPCSTKGRTPPCTEALIETGVRKVVIGAIDPNPRHARRALKILKRAGMQVVHGILAEECAKLNEAFNHWIVRRTPFVTVKSAMTLDGRIATASGESKWITGPKARAYGMTLREEADAILVGINTMLADDPALTVRGGRVRKPIRRIILDSFARTPLNSKVASDKFREFTTIVVSKLAPKSRVRKLAAKVTVIEAPAKDGKLDLKWLMKRLGKEDVTSLLVEGGGEVNESFLLGGIAQRIAFFRAPMVLGGRDARRAVGGEGVQRVADMVNLRDVQWQWLGADLLLSARIA
jgi:diaminohydroxyphosphoribosylaminopyrimidine deaminase/5-amino-6-(5-phosphoribosylamino)uracil reductase